MQTNSPIINDANLVNSINSRAYSLSNQGLIIDRGIMISNYTQETIDSCWAALSTNVVQNYQKGKATYIKNFGTFTFKPDSINLEGTTNQYSRDKKPKMPVFIVSKEYIRDLAAGEYTKQNGIRYYIQKENKDISIVKLNFAQIAYSISLFKDEAMNLINNLILYLMENIAQKKFKNKLLPGVGVLLTRGNIVAVKFDNNLIEENKYKTHINTFTKKNISMDMDMSKAQEAIVKDCVTPYKNMESLKAKNSLITRMDNTAKTYLKNNFKTDVINFPQHEIKNIYKTIEKNVDCTFNFLNDRKTLLNNFYKIKKNISNIRLKKTKNEENNLPLGFLDEDILKDFEYFKGILIKNCKNYDNTRNGMITKEEVIQSFLKSNMNPKIDYNLAKSIVDEYNKTDNVEYMKFIAQLIKDSKLTLLKTEKKNKLNLDNNNINNINNFKKAFSTEKKIRLKKSSTQFYEEEKKQKKLLESTNSTNNFNRTNLSRSQNKFLSPKNDINNNILISRQKETDSIKKRLTNIIKLIPELKKKHFISLDQKLSSEEFLNILKNNSISYPKESIEELLIFLGIPDINAFSLREFEQYLINCKILTTNLEISNLNEIMKKLRDIVYINGGKSFFFGEGKNSINCETFVNLFKSKNSPYDEDILINIFFFLVKTDRNFNENDYYNYFEHPDMKINFNEPHFLVMMQKLQNIISQRNLKPEEYFDFLISKNKSTKDVVLTRLNWINYLQGENMKCTAEELDKFFNWVDRNNDGVIDRAEFLGRFEYRNKPLTSIKNIVLENKLDIEDLAHRMGIGMNDLFQLNFENFKKKIKMLDYTYSDNFILELFEELTKKKQKYLTSKQILDEINYIKPPETYNSFIKHYTNTIRNKISHEELKSQFEKLDTDFLGTLTKLEFVKALTPLFPEFTDQDHLLFLRVTNMLDNEGNVTYTKLLNYIYYFCGEKLNDLFTKMCEILSNTLINQCDEDIEKLMYLIDTGVAQKKTSLIVHQPLSINQIKKFLEKNDKNTIFPEKIIQKLDIDADGYISFEDLRSVLKRFVHTSFFKFSNEATDPNINLFSKEKMSEMRFKGIVKKLNDYIKKKNINQVGLFRKFDKDNDGFISNIDFNSVIDEIMPLAPAMKDQFFNYLDFYHNGLIDLNTFIVALEGFSNSNVLIQNNNKIENEILSELKKFIIKNSKLSDNEIFEVMDKDCDGLLNIDDFRKFVVDNLKIPEKEFNNSKLQRVMMTISLSKNGQIGLNDLREMINLCNENREHMNLKEVFKLTTNQNLSQQKKNKEWTNDIIERLGMFVSEKYDSIEQFFEENTEKGQNKFKFTDLIKFHENNFELFNNGFNLTNDELLSLFTSLDSHKKNYLTLQDLKNKLQIYNFYNKMHIDVKNFIQENFMNGIDAFKFFKKKEINYDKEDNDKYHITLKEFFDTFEIFFPKKYSTNTILKYVNKYFNITTSNNKTNLINKKDTITFSEFNYVYFDSLQDNSFFLKNKIYDTKLMTNRSEISEKMKNDLIHNPQNNFYYANLFKKNYKELLTPFDKDPLNKIKRILSSSKYNLNKFFAQLEKECGPNNYVVNKYQFRNIIKTLDLGLSNLEIDQIMHKCGKVTYDGNLNLKEFVTYLYSVNQILEEGKNNMIPIISEIKELIYKYYSSPIICFQNNDINHIGKIDFENFKNIIYDMYTKNEQPLPNFTLIKNAFDTIDLRKDGMIDINEWCKVLGAFNGKLDFGEENVPNGFDFYDNNKFLKLKTLKKGMSLSKINNRRVLREWETSSDVSEIYKYINKNKKFIQQKIKNSNYSLGSGSARLIQPDNLVLILKGIIPNNNLSLTQWKMIVNVAKKDTLDGLIDLNEFFRLMEVTTKKMTSHPSITKKKLLKSASDLSAYNLSGVNGPMFKTISGAFKSNNKKNIFNRMGKDLRYMKKIDNNLNIQNKPFNRTSMMQAIS